MLLAIASLLLSAPALAQDPADPTSCSLQGLRLFHNPDCRDAPGQWPIPAGGCLNATALAVVGPAELLAAGLQGPFSFVSGHTDPVTGREFALLSGSNGFAIIDAHDVSAHGPTEATPRIWTRLEPCVLPMPWCGAIHRGTVAHGEHVYETNSFRPFLRVTRLEVSRLRPGLPPQVTIKALPDVPLPLGASYRMTVDKERSHLYVPSAAGLHIFDIAGARAGAPVLLAVWRGWSANGPIPSWDVHLHRDGATVRAVVSEYLTTGAPNHIAILDVTNLPAGNLNWTPPNWVAWPASVPGSGNVHSAWMPADGSLLFSSLGDVMTVVHDLRGFSQYSANRVLGFFEVPPLVQVFGRSPTQDLVYPAAPRRHMGLQGIGYTGYAPSWQDGLIVYDLRPDCTEPNTVLAQLDTSLCRPGSNGGGPSCGTIYPGAFAAYRLQDSGVVYVADETNGLFLVRLNVGHVHRFGRGTAELHNGRPLLPRITLDRAPARSYADPLRDGGQGLAVRDLVPGRSIALMIGSEGLQSGVPFPAPHDPCQLWLGGFVAGPFLYQDHDFDGVVEVALPPGIPYQWRVFVQAFSLAPAGSGLRCAASTRGTWFGMARPR